MAEAVTRGLAGNADGVFMRSDVGSWLASLGFATESGGQPEVLLSIVLAERSGGELSDSSHRTGSCFGGRAVSDWPRDVAGDPLAHVATIDLAEVHRVLEDMCRVDSSWSVSRPPLPPVGYLDIFHDLAEWGYDPDAPSGTVVHFVGADGMSPAAIDHSGELYVPSPVDVGVRPVAAFSVPAEAIGEAPESAEESINELWTSLRADSPEPDGPWLPPSRMFGHSDHGDDYAHEILEQVLPLSAPDDHYVLLLSVESWTYFNGWFGDAGTFEVWMRRTDLAAARFGSVWGMVRND